jgi:phosphoglycerate dehydrogenase-like enzyme
MNATAKLTIGCDLFLDLSLYRVPASFQDQLRSEFPEIKLMEVNTPTAESMELSSIDIYWGNRITEDLISELKRLKWIHFGSVGVNRALVREIKDRKILVTNSKGIMTDAVAASALAFVFALARGFHRAWNIRVENRMDRQSFDTYFEQIQDVFGQSCLIVGLGEIGEKLGNACASIGMKVSGVKKNTTKVPVWLDKVYSIGELNQAVQNVDYVINLLPLFPQTRNVFDAQIFNNMKKSAFFINLGRGDTVNEPQLAEALKNDTIAGAGLDVFSSASYVSPTVPLTSDSPFWNLENVILTPHVAGITTKYWKKECELFMQNLRNFINGTRLLNEVDIDIC